MNQSKQTLVVLGLSLFSLPYIACNSGTQMGGKNGAVGATAKSSKATAMPSSPSPEKSTPEKMSEDVKVADVQGTGTNPPLTNTRFISPPCGTERDLNPTTHLKQKARSLLRAISA